MRTVTLKDTPVTRFIRNMRDLKTVYPKAEWTDLARRVRRQSPDLCLEVMDMIGCWTSSEPELAALQQIWS